MCQQNIKQIYTIVRLLTINPELIIISNSIFHNFFVPTNTERGLALKTLPKLSSVRICMQFGAVDSLFKKMRSRALLITEHIYFPEKSQKQHNSQASL